MKIRPVVIYTIHKDRNDMVYVFYDAIPGGRESAVMNGHTVLFKRHCIDSELDQCSSIKRYKVYPYKRSNLVLLLKDETQFMVRCKIMELESILKKAILNDTV